MPCYAKTKTKKNKNMQHIIVHKTLGIPKKMGRFKQERSANEPFLGPVLPFMLPSWELFHGWLVNGFDRCRRHGGPVIRDFCPAPAIVRDGWAVGVRIRVNIVLLCTD